MNSTTVSFKVTDSGEYHNTLVKIKMGKDQLMIRYGFKSTDTNFFPCSAILLNGKVYLQKVLVGKLGDIKIQLKDWLKILKGIGNKELFDLWSKHEQLA